MLRWCQINETMARIKPDIKASDSPLPDTVVYSARLINAIFRIDDLIGVA